MALLKIKFNASPYVHINYKMLCRFCLAVHILITTPHHCMGEMKLWIRSNIKKIIKPQFSEISKCISGSQKYFKTLLMLFVQRDQHVTRMRCVGVRLSYGNRATTAAAVHARSNNAVTGCAMILIMAVRHIG